MEIADDIKTSWIYDFSDYQQMYDLTQQDLSKTIFDFSAGIACFNAEATKRHAHVISADASYDLPENEMKQFAEKFLQEAISSLKKNPERLRDKSNTVMDRVANLWKKTEEKFLSDYAKGRAENRYVKMQLPKMSYKKNQFDLALCTDFIFHHLLSSENIAVIVEELCRVASEVRIFPLLDNEGNVSDELGPLMLMLQQKNYGVEVREVPYKTLNGGNAMLRIWEQECQLS